MTEPDAVRLRPIEETDLEALRRIDTDPSLSLPFEWMGFRDPGERRRRLEEDGYISDAYSMLAVSLPDGTFAGFVCWWPTETMAPPRSVFEVGILLMPEQRGKGFGSIAQGLLVDYLFSTTLANRLQASTDVENVAERGALERAGFQLEGIQRGVAFVGGEWRDGVVYARLREDARPLAS
ncbi:MAG: GNAT family protein [Candidatus Dormiibacterota bacterium]